MAQANNASSISLSFCIPTLPCAILRENKEMYDHRVRRVGNSDRWNQALNTPTRRLATRRGTRNPLSLWEQATHFPHPTPQPCFHCLEETIENDEISILVVALLLRLTRPSWTKQDCDGRSAKLSSNNKRVPFGSRLGGEAGESLA